MKRTTTILYRFKVLFLSILIVLPSTIFGFSVDFRPYAESINDNVGFGPYTQPEWEFSLEGRTKIDYTNDMANPFTEGVPGTVFLGELDRLECNCISFCVGVQSDEWDSSNEKYKGSKAISGENKHRDEALIFNFDEPQLLSGIRVGFCGFIISRENVDSVSLTIRYSDNSIQTFRHVNPYFIEEPEGIVMLDLASLTNPSGSSVDRLALRSLNKHFGVGSISSDVSLDANDPELSIPASFKLSANFPNPFNPSTTIEYSLPSRAFVVITVYNLLGQEIKKLVNESIPAGQHLVIWDGTDDSGNTVSTGIYFYRLNTDSFSESKKMILLK